MTENQSTKITRLEVEMKNVTSEIVEVKTLVKEVITKVDSMRENYVSRGEFESFKANLEKDGIEQRKSSDLIRESLIKTLIPIILVGLMFVAVNYINSVYKIGPK